MGDKVMDQPGDERAPRVVLSVVSHGQGRLVRGLLSDIRSNWNPAGLRLVLTQNLAEAPPPEADQLPFPVRIVRNLRPRGFAANHNNAFEMFDSDIFCVINPDVRCPRDPVPDLVAELDDPGTGLVAPRIISPQGRLEDSARRQITPLRLLRRAAGFDREPDYDIDDTPFCPDWVAGMFMAMRSPVYRDLGGFDERYRLYCEDADLCMRLWSGGYRVTVVPRAWAVHDARRESHRNLRLLRWHVISLLRFLARYPVDQRAHIQ
jgi:GT2 family glycosyltransferase